jgi:chromosome segregation ATPase
MKIEQHSTIYMGENKNSTNAADDKEKSGKKGNVIYVGKGTQNSSFDQIAAKRKEAKKKAMKVIRDAWAGDQAIEDDLQQRRDKISSLREENGELRSNLRDINDAQDALKEQYGITEDSQEEKDLEILRKEKNFTASGDEMMYALKLRAEGLSDYQSRQLELDDQKDHFQKKLDKNNQSIIEENAIVRGIRLEKLKSDPMVDAQKQADAIEDAASQEIIGMLMDDAKEQIDQKSEEKQEQAEEAKENKEEQEELIEKQKEKKDDLEELIEDMPMDELLSMSRTKNEALQEVKNMLSKMKLVEEDIKGAAVDEEV